MTEAHVRSATHLRFWERIRDRYRGRRGFLRSRALLVHRRPVRFAAEAVARVRPIAPIARQQFVLQINLHTLAWPPGIGRHGGTSDAKRREALQALLMLGGLPTPSHRLPSQVNERPVTSPAGSRAIASPAIAPAGRTTAGRSSGAPESARIADEPMMWRAPDRVLGFPAPPRPAGSRETNPQGRLVLIERTQALRERGIFATAPGRVIRSVQAVAVSTPPASAVPAPGITANGSRPLVHTARPPSSKVAGRDRGRSPDRVADVHHAIGGEFPFLFPHLNLSELAPASRLVGEARSGPSTVQGYSAPPLYVRPVTRSLAIPPAGPSSHDAPPEPRAAKALPPEIRIPTPPPIDLERLTEDVYHHLQRRMRIERERRGL